MAIKAANPVALEAMESATRRPVAEAPRLARSGAAPRIVMLRRRDDDDGAAGLLAGLLDARAHTDPKFFYDAQGCALFDAICQLDEYYPTRTEAGIVAQYRGEIARQIPRGAQWVDLGAGDGAKAREWLSAICARRYLGVDIAEVWLAPAVERIDAAFERVEAIGVVADLTEPLALHALLAERADAPPVFFYPGSSIGNFTPPRALELLRAIRAHCGDGGRLLIGVDLVKDVRVLEAAYDDALGVTAAFNRNVLRVANRLLGADFDPDGFEHVARFDAIESRIEMRLHARHEQTVRFTRPQHAERTFAAGEIIVTEYSYKYTPQTFGTLLKQAGFAASRMWTDESTGFGVFLAAP